MIQWELKTDKREHMLEHISKLNKKDYIFTPYERDTQRHRTYYLYKIGKFETLYEASPPHLRFMQEAIYGDSEARLYFELDFKCNAPMYSDEWNKLHEEWNKFLNTLKKITIKLHEKHFGVGSLTESDYVEWHAHRDNQFSTHLIFDSWFENPEHVWAFVSECGHLLGDEKFSNKKTFRSAIDEKPYPRHGCGMREVRLPYSNKRLEPDQTEIKYALLQKSGTVPEPVDLNLLRRSYISHGFDPEAGIKVRSMNIDTSKGPAFNKDFNIFDSIDYEKINAAVITWLNQKEKVESVISIKPSASGSHINLSWRVKTLFCEGKQDRHLSNSTFLNVYFTQRGHFVRSCYYCTDCMHEWKTELPVNFLFSQNIYNDANHDAIDEEGIEQSIVWDDDVDLNV